MRFPSLCLAIGSLVIAVAPAAIAQPQPPAPPARQPATVAAPRPKVLTGKERLGEKWQDEQRVDNCKVPPDKRGPKPRPDSCRGTPSR